MPAAHDRLILRHFHRLAVGREAALPDRDLISRYLQKRDEAAFAALVERHGPLVLNVCQSVLRHRHDAEDAFQATFLVLARHARSIRRRECLGSWLHGVAYRVAQKARSAAARRQVIEAHAPCSAPVMPADDLTWGEVRGILHRELAALPERFREPLVLCYLEGLTLEEAARRLGWPSATVKGRLQRGRDRLRRRLERHGLGLAAVGAAALTGEALAAPVSAVLTRAAVRAALLRPGETAALTVAALARGIGSPLMPAPVRAVTSLLFVTALLAGGVALFSPRLADDQPPTAVKPEVQPSHAVADRFGDPLPEGAVARLGTVRLNHGDDLNALHFTPDGKTILSEGRGVVHLWDAVTGKQLRQFATGEFSFDDGTLLTPDGKTLLTLNQEGSEDGDVVRAWDLAEGKEVRTIKLPVRRSLSSVNLRNALAPDGKLAAIQTAEQVLVFDLTTGQELWQLPRERVKGRGLLFAGNNRLVTVEAERHIEVWEARTGKPLCQAAHGAPLDRLATSADGRWLAGVERQMSPFKLPKGEVLQVHERDVIQVWDLAKGARKQSLTAQRDRLHFHLQFSPDGKFLFASGMDDGRAKMYTLTVWDVEQGQAVRELAGACGRSLAVSPDGTRLAEADQGKIDVWDLKSGRRLTDDPRPAIAESLFLSPAGDRVTTLDFASLATWDATNGRLLSTFDLPPYPYGDPGRSHFFSPDGRYAASLREENGRVQILIWDIAARRLLLTLRPPGEPQYMPATARNVTRVYMPPQITCAFSPDGARLASSHPGKEPVLRLWDLRTGKELGSFATSKLPWTAKLYFAPDGKTLFAHGLRVNGYDTVAGKELFSWRTPPLPNKSGVRIAVVGGPPLTDDDYMAWRNLVVSPDGTLAAGILASGGWNGERVENRIVLCEARTGKVLRRWSDSGQSSRWLEQLAFSRDGRLLATTDGDLVRVWEVATGKEVRSFRGHHGQMASLAFSANGRRLASAATDSTVLIWDLTLHPVEPAAAAPGAKELAAWWDALAHEDAGPAQAAIWRLAEAPAASVPLLRERLKPATDEQVKEMHRLIGDLDHETFTVREQAFRRLEDLGPAAEVPLHEALKKNPSAEARRRVEQLLEKLTEGPLTGESLRTLRSLAVLERAGTPEARHNLRELADGAAGAWLTREAKLAVERLVDGAVR